MLGNVLKSFEFKKQNQINAFRCSLLNMMRIMDALMKKKKKEKKDRSIFPLLFILIILHFAIKLKMLF